MPGLRQGVPNSRKPFVNLLDFIKDNVLVLDGAMGTQIQALALEDADFGGTDFRMLADLLVFSKPDHQRAIHLGYFHEGAHAVETNTFGASPLRLSEYDFSKLDLAQFDPVPWDLDLRALSYEEMAYYLSKRGAELACEARHGYRYDPDYDNRPLYVIGSIGPSNRVLSSTDADLSVSTFDAIVDNFYHQVRGLLDGGVDVLLYETQQDILELKAAVMGGQKAMAEAGKRLPIMCQVAVDAFGKMQIFNTDIHAALVAVQGIGVDTFGINCSVGPDLMVKTVETLSRVSPLPISVVPNAGLPVSEGGETVFKFKPEDMADYLDRFVTEFGVSVVGGCCGTTPHHIHAIADRVRGHRPVAHQPKRATYISGPQEVVELDSSEGLILIGERLNVRGSIKVRDAVEGEGELDQHALEEVVGEQVTDLGLRIIDVCMDSNTVDTTETLKQVIHSQTTHFQGAMSIDSFAVDALEEAIKVYPGRPIINSMSMEEYAPGVTKIEAVIAATKAHWPMYIGLAAGPKGPGATRDEKTDLARQIVEKAGEFGVTPDQILIDMNVFPLGSESEEGMNFALESLEAIPLIKAIHPDLRTVCGVGNLTTGLAKKPYMRKVLTSVWLDEGRKRGLDAAIVNPNHYVFVQDLDPNDYQLGLRAVLEHDMDAFARLEDIAEEKTGATVVRRTTYDDLDLEAAICEKIKDGYKEREAGTVVVDGHTYCYGDRIVHQVVEIIRKYEPLDFINRYLMVAMNDLGDGFARGEVSLPHLLKSADVMKQVMGFLEEYMKVESGVDLHAELKYKGTIVLGTVYQDVHSIGKDLAKTLFENYGYRVIDLGVMTPLQQYIDVAREHKATAIGMSALLVQTSNHMITVAKMMAEQGCSDLPILIGGAPVNDRHAAYVAMAGDEDTARMRANVFYCATAMDGVNVMNSWGGNGDRTVQLDANRAKLLDHFERATRRAAEDEELLATLPRRAVSFEEHRLPKNPYFRREAVRYGMREFKSFLDTKTLFALNWKFGGKAARDRRGETQEHLLELLDEWIDKCEAEQWIQPQGLYGVYPAQSEGEDVILYDPDDFSTAIARFAFDLVIGAGRKDTVCAAQYFKPVESGEFDAMGVQVATCGPAVDEAIATLRRNGDTEGMLYLQGLSDRCAEDLGDNLHRVLRERLGFDSKHGIRWSPGYPAISNTVYNKTLVELLEATHRIGLRTTDAGEFSPTGSTGAVVCFHPDARYT
jgi:5-methyltetrahydrofolate--homocysteine methyltransferase